MNSRNIWKAESTGQCDRLMIEDHVQGGVSQECRKGVGYWNGRK